MRQRRHTIESVLQLPERTRKCLGAGAGSSGRAVRAFVPPVAAIPRRPLSQYVSPRPPALPPPALACHALPFLAWFWLPFGSRAGSGKKRVPSGYTSGGASWGVEGREDLRPVEGCGARRWDRPDSEGASSGRLSGQGRAKAAWCPKKGPAPVFLNYSMLSREGGKP